ncbi:MAG: hypothetical protein VKM92_00790 [Cyanobacteriota bacterium]|nr:hypothetical protein [Cyanobacteriota bacterium]
MSRRRKAALAAPAVAQALELGTEVVQELRSLGKGYSPLKDAAPRNLPADQRWFDSASMASLVAQM